MTRWMNTALVGACALALALTGCGSTDKPLDGDAGNGDGSVDLDASGIDAMTGPDARRMDTCPQNGHN